MEMIYASSNQSKWSTTKHSCLLGKWDLVLSHLCHSNEQRTSMISTLKKPALVLVQLGWWRDILHLRNITTRCWQLQWSHPGKSPKWVQGCPHLHRIPYQFRKQTGRPKGQTNPLISNQFIYNSSNATHHPSSHRECHHRYVDHHGHHDPCTTQCLHWKHRSFRKWRRPTRWWRRKYTSSRPTRWKAHGSTAYDLQRGLLKSWELHSRILHPPPS